MHAAAPLHVIRCQTHTHARCRGSTLGLNRTQFWHVCVTSTELIFLLAVNINMRSVWHRCAFDGDAALCQTHLSACVTVSASCQPAVSVGLLCMPPSSASASFQLKQTCTLSLHIPLYIYMYFFPFASSSVPLPSLTCAPVCPSMGLGGVDSLLPLQSLHSVSPPPVCCDLAPLSRRRSPH